MLLFTESFDNNDTAGVASKWGSGSVSSLPSGRTGNAASLTTNTTNLTHTVSSGGVSTIVVGMALNIPSIASAIAALALLEGSTVHVDVRLQSDRSILITRNGTTLVTCPAASFAFSTWQYWELKTTIHDSAGTVELRINGSAVGSGSSLDTRNGGTGVVNSIRLNGGNGVANLFDDLYVCDTSGSVNNDFLGDIKVESLLPSGAGATTQWTASAGSNYQCVDDATPNTSDYNSSSTANQIDTFAMGDLATTSGTVLGVQTSLYYEKDDAGARSIAPVLRPSSTDRVGTTVNANSSYAFTLQVWETDPDDSSAWSVTKINNLEAGYKCIS